MVLRKLEGKCEGEKRKEKWKESEKKKFKFNKLFLYVSSNSFDLLLTII